ncbi:MAG: hypothetical protein EP343_19195 [Deltaproteobacteria bacterium]|nr:MAG: hypothetical protein EP343_19195 [Deltaproteobacteria bacterium]
MKQHKALMFYVLLGVALLFTPQNASAGAVRDFCSAHDQQLAQDMATTAASILAFHGGVSTTCYYLIMTWASQQKSDQAHKANESIAKVVPRFIKASKGFFQVMVPTSKRVSNALRSHNEYMADVFKGSFVNSFTTMGMKNLPLIQRCKNTAIALYKFRAVMLAAMAYLAVTKSICATAKAIDPHCKRSSKHKNKCTLPIYNEHSMVPNHWTPRSNACSAVQDQKLQSYINLAQSSRARLKYFANFNAKLRKLLRVPAKKLKQSAKVASYVGKKLKTLKPGFVRFDKVLDTMLSGLKPLNGLLSKKVCVPIKVVSKKKKCSKVKVPGKKKKKNVCKWKLTTKKQNVCSSVKGISKMAATLQKPMDKAVDALAKPILSYLPKSIPLPGLSKAKSLGRQLKNSFNIGGLGSLKSALDKAKKYTAELNRLHSSLKLIQSGLR